MPIKHPTRARSAPAAVYPNFGTGPFNPLDPALRRALDEEIELLIALLDAIDGDYDLEDGQDHEPEVDDEPSLAATHDINQENWSQGARDDSEVDELGPLARATHSILGELVATRETSARLGAILARLSGVEAGQAVAL